MRRDVFQWFVFSCVHRIYLQNGWGDYFKRGEFNGSFILHFFFCEYEMCYILITKSKTFNSKFNLTCEENEWKLAIIGTVKNVAEMAMLPFFGLLSDR